MKSSALPALLGLLMLAPAAFAESPSYSRLFACDLAIPRNNIGFFEVLSRGLTDQSALFLVQADRISLAGPKVAVPATLREEEDTIVMSATINSITFEVTIPLGYARSPGKRFRADALINQEPSKLVCAFSFPPR